VSLFFIWTDAAGSPPPSLPIQLTKSGGPAPADKSSPVVLEYDNINQDVDPAAGLTLTFTLAESAVPASAETDITEGSVTRRRLRPDLVRDAYVLLKYSMS
jgi:hypothetical protein